jgi:hypothetical protein
VNLVDGGLLALDRFREAIGTPSVSCRRERDLTLSPTGCLWRLSGDVPEASTSDATRYLIASASVGAVGLVTEVSRRHGYAHQASFRMELVSFLLPQVEPWCHMASGLIGVGSGQDALIFQTNSYGAP